jgi:hypothetical protein
MKISADEQAGIRAAIDAGKRFGFGNIISHLKTAWAKTLVADYGYSNREARKFAGDGMPFAMQDDVLERGEWDETGSRYAAKAE